GDCHQYRDFIHAGAASCPDYSREQQSVQGYVGVGTQVGDNLDYPGDHWLAGAGESDYRAAVPAWSVRRKRHDYDGDGAALLPAWAAVRRTGFAVGVRLLCPPRYANSGVDWCAESGGVCADGGDFVPALWLV